MIYLASPYSHPDAAVREARFVAACRATGWLMSHGKHVYSPIATCHPIATCCALPTDWDYWLAHDREILTRLCDSLTVLMLDGWQQSVGVQAEIAIMRELDRPIDYLEWNITWTSL